MQKQSYNWKPGATYLIRVSAGFARKWNRLVWLETDCLVKELNKQVFGEG